MYNTFRQGVLVVKKTFEFCVRRIDFLDSIKLRSVAELKITSIGYRSKLWGALCFLI